jgi:hypothetical protein
MSDQPANAGPAASHPTGRPARRMSKLAIVYLITAAGGLGLYAAGMIGGWEHAPGQRSYVPQSVRQSPGGYRSYFFVHGGYQGGK